MLRVRWVTTLKLTEIHKDYLEPSKEGMEKEEPSGSGSTTKKTDLRSGVHNKCLHPRGKRERLFFSLVADYLKCKNDVPALIRQ